MEILGICSGYCCRLYAGKVLVIVQSDLPDDYLNLYGNCKATYSDRIHACVATLAFGNPARLYSKSERFLLFDRVGLSSIRDNIVSLDRGKIEKEKKKQIDFLRGIFTKR